MDLVRVGSNSRFQVLGSSKGFWGVNQLTDEEETIEQENEGQNQDNSSNNIGDVIFARRSYGTPVGKHKEGN